MLAAGRRLGRRQTEPRAGLGDIAKDAGGLFPFATNRTRPLAPHGPNGKGDPRRAERFS
jgi:hypothetical protein